jgi:plasmid stabilization system protein ParE
VTFRVQFTQEATEDLERLFDFIVERELARDGELDVAQQALDAIRRSIETLKWTPFTCRKVGSSPFLRELVISFGHTGYVALFEIVDDRTVVVAAVRHQREDDYH